MKENIKIVVCLTVLVAAFVAIKFVDVSALMANREKARICPDAEGWILYEGEGWFVIDGEMWQTRGFDTEWTEKNCDIKRPTESTRSISG